MCPALAASRQAKPKMNPTARPKRGDVKRSGIANGMFAAQIQALYQHIPMVLIVNVVNSALVAIVLAAYKGQIWWLVFLALSIAVSCVRAFGWARYRRKTVPPSAAAAWAMSATLGSAISGLLWGAGSALLLADNLVEQTFVAFVIGGMCVASLVAFSNYLPAFIAYVFPSSLPLASRFFLDGWTVHGDMMVVFSVAITLAAYSSTRSFVNGLCLNLHLIEKTKQLTAANERLKTEIEQRKAVEDQLRQAHKMEALGQLTGGIAHDFNNLLTVVIGHLELAHDRIGVDSRPAALLQVALRAAERGAALTRHLLAFARRQHLDPRPVDIAAVIGSAEKILMQTIGPDIRLVIQSTPDLHPAWVDPNQLELAILNLALNARDAMPSGGVLRIDTQNRQRDRDIASTEPLSQDYVVVSVSDTGTGMSKEILERAFEPFFTTKEAGHGSGLGLSIVHGFAAQSGGSVRIASTPGQGTRVDLWLPRARSEAFKCLDVEPDQSIIEPSQAKILVCDDDGGVLTFVGAVLRGDGYTVWEAGTPSEALEIVERERPIDLLLVDYAMPEMNGLAVIDRARDCQRGLKTLMMSGHADILHSAGMSGVPLLAKPFKVAELRKRIAEIMFPRFPELARTDAGLRDFAMSD
jgi:signal transduction histidine kinase/CheY-like chemotaxis protein